MISRLDSTLRFLRITVDQAQLAHSTDEQLLVQFHKKRDEFAFEEILRRYGPMVLAICRRALEQPADVDDAFQATFLVLIRKAGSIRARNLLPNWLCAVAYKVTRKAQQRRWKLLAREQQVDRLPESAYEAGVPRDWLPYFDDALQRLPAKYRSAVVLCDLEGQSRVDAAKRLGLSENTLSSRLARAREMLRLKLQRHGFPLSFLAAVAPAVIPQDLFALTLRSARLIDFTGPVISLAKGVITGMLFGKIKTSVAVLAVLVTLGFFGSQLGSRNQAEAQAKSDQEIKAPGGSTLDAPKHLPQTKQLKTEDELGGDWKIVGAEQFGFDATDELVTGKTETLGIQFAGPNGGNLKWGNREGTLRFSVDPSKSPKEITSVDATTKMVNGLGIYQVQGNNLTICLSDSKDHPKAFRTEPGSSDILYRCERVKKLPESGTDQQKFQGYWKAVSAVRDGIDYTGKLRDLQWCFDEKRLSISSNGSSITSGRWVINSKVAQPMIMFPSYFQIQREQLMAMNCIGIYAFDNARLKIAFRPMEGKTKPPSTFSGDNGDGTGMLVLERIEPPKPKESNEFTDPRAIDLPNPLSGPPGANRESLPPTPLSPTGTGSLIPAEPPLGTPRSLSIPPALPSPSATGFPGISTPLPGSIPPAPTAPTVPSPSLRPDESPRGIPISPVGVPEPTAPPSVIPGPTDITPLTPNQLPAANEPRVVENISTPRPPLTDAPKENEQKKLDDQSLMQGKWCCIDDGGKREAELTSEMVEIVRDVMICDDGHVERIRLDSSTSPKRIDLARIQAKDAMPEVRYGIYKIEGNKLLICLQKAKTPRLRPAEFVNDAEAQIELLVFQRPEPSTSGMTLPSPKNLQHSPQFFEKKPSAASTDKKNPNPEEAKRRAEMLELQKRLAELEKSVLSKKKE